MRTTVDLDEDVLAFAKHVAYEKGQSLGRVLTELIRRGMAPSQERTTKKGDLPSLPRMPGAKPVTSQVVKHLFESGV